MLKLFRSKQLLSWIFGLFAVVLIVARLLAVQITAAQSVADPSVVGSWAGPFSWPLVPIHVSVGPNGKVIAWQRPKLAPSGPQSIVWDPATNQFTPAPSVATDIFCAGHAFAPSGRLLVAGGHEGPPTPDPNQVADIGSDDTNVYDFGTNKWISYLNKMNKGRWYPTVTYLATGEAVVVAGTNTGEKDIVTVPEVWGTSGSNYRSLTTAPLALENYPWGFVAPSGRVFYTGQTRTTRVLDTAGTGKWSTVSNNSLGNRFYGSSVMYDNGKFLIVGGGLEKYSGLATNTAEVIDLNVSTQWIPVNPMSFRRKHLNATLLPDGKVIVTGGTGGPGFNTAIANGVDYTALPAEIWDPATKQWSTTASMKVGRYYHSFAALLPDGRVMVGGGGLPLAAGELSDATDPKNQGHYDVEFYSPPYLFQETRPAITSAPTSVIYGQQFVVQTPDSADIANVNWIRLASVTHSFNANQRINRLSFTQTTGGLNVTAPSDRNLCPPGHYMLFILKNGIPSIAKIIQIT